MAKTNQIRSKTLRDKLLKVLGDGDFFKLQYSIFYLNHLVEADSVCDWLIRNGMTGKRLQEWQQEKFEGFFLPMFDEIRSKINRQRAGMPVLLGKDICRPS